MEEEGERDGGGGVCRLPAFHHCGLCGETLVVMGASVSMQISVCLPKCLCGLFSVHLALNGLQQKARLASMLE